MADVNTPINTIVNEVNGNLDNANIKSGAAIATSKLADDAGITYAKVAAGFPVQIVSSFISAAASGSTVIPHDDTIPQNNEGTEFMTLSITPKASTNLLIVEAVAMLSSDTSGRNIVAALFQDTTVDAKAVMNFNCDTALAMFPVTVSFSMTAGTTSSTTFKLRAGSGSNPATITINGRSGARFLGGVPKSWMKITEIKV